MENQISVNVGDTVFAIGFAFDGEELINNYSGYGKVSKILAPGMYCVSFGEDDTLECYDSTGTNENAPEIIIFRDKDIVYCKDGVIGVYLKDFLYLQ
jgi:hypothetical protein